jgi:RHS repeat-associated protein
VTQCSAYSLALGMSVKNQISNSGFSYDAAGNFTNGISVLLTYDAENRIAGAGTSTYVYSPAGRRVKRTVSSATTLYMNDGSGGPVLSEFNYTGIGQGSWIKDYIYLNGQLLATESATQGTRYHFSDHLGTPRVITNSDATWIVRHDYYPFGREVGVSTDGETHKFTGKERDVETGLHFFGARYYHETHGRFMSADAPFADQEKGEPQSWNLYTYGRNNPLNGVDPTGRGWITKAVKLIVKGGDVAATVADVVDSAKTLTAVNSTTGERVLAGASILSEFLPLSIGDAKAAGRAIGLVGDAAKKGDNLVDPSLAKRAREIQDNLPDTTKGRTTTAVGQVTSADGSTQVLVGSSEGTLREAQKQALQAGETAVSGTRGVHAEVNVINAAAEQGLQVNAVAASRPICPGCEQAIKDAGAVPASELKGKP